MLEIHLLAESASGVFGAYHMVVGVGEGMDFANVVHTLAPPAIGVAIHVIHHHAKKRKGAPPKQESQDEGD